MEEQSKAVQVFNFQGNDFRVVVVEGEPWFVINDVCKVLELGNVSRVIDRLDSDGVTQSKVTDSSGRIQNMAVANEPNLYRLIFRSDKPEAKAFQDEVYNKVLPSIRKTGAYVAPGQQLPLQGNIVDVIEDPRKLRKLIHHLEGVEQLLYPQTVKQVSVKARASQTVFGRSRKMILDLLNEQQEPLGVRAMIHQSMLPGMHPRTIRSALERMVNQGQIRRTSLGYYQKVTEYDREYP